MKKYGVLIADDSALMRRTLKRIIEKDRWLFVAGTARDGEDAVNKARELRPSVVAMDINMPVLDGISALQMIVEERICPVVMVSSLTQEGAITTFECLELGAFDFVAKPGGTVSINMDQVARELVTKLKAAAKSGQFSRLERISSRMKKPVHRAARARKAPSVRKASGIDHYAVAIGISTGGPKVLFEMLAGLDPSANAAYFLVQHMPPGFTASFAERLDNNSPIPFVEAQPGMKVEPGQGYLAKGGYHLKLYRKPNKEIVIRCSSRPDHQFIPSVNIMMESVLQVYQANTIGVLMTGMGDDGADSMVKIRQAGGTTIAESEESAIVFGMPQQAIERGGAEIVAPLWEIAERIDDGLN